MDPALADHWTTVDPPARCYACTALAKAVQSHEDDEQPQALRYIVGLREGWEEVRELAARGEGAAAG